MLSAKWFNTVFPFQDITPEVPSPDGSPSPKPCVPRCLWPGPPLGNQSLSTDVRGQCTASCSGMSQNVLSVLWLVLFSWLMCQYEFYLIQIWFVLVSTGQFHCTGIGLYWLIPLFFLSGWVYPQLLARESRCTLVCKAEKHITNFLLFF